MVVHNDRTDSFLKLDHNSLYRSQSQMQRIGVSAVIFNRHPAQMDIPLKTYLLRKENEPWKGLWCFPGGKVEFGETYQQATKRETMEETGINLALFEENSPIYATNVLLKELQYLVVTSVGYCEKQVEP